MRIRNSGTPLDVNGNLEWRNATGLDLVVNLEGTIFFLVHGDRLQTPVPRTS